MMKLVRYLLLPIVPLYYLVTWLRNKLYDLGVKKSVAYDFPVICVGNLSVGGTGKSPMIEYLIRLLSPDYKIATLSRGYKRQSEGFIVADKYATAAEIGDEPYQFYQKFKEIIVSVDNQRIHGISKLRTLENPPEIILLDDAYQHRKVTAGYQILLTSFGDLYTDDLLLPTGNLREPMSGAKRADVIVVTKCPLDLSDQEKERITRKINPLPHQELFFGSIAYATSIKNRDGVVPLNTLKDHTFTLVTGIANPKPLIEHLKGLGMTFEHLKFKDHYAFNARDIDHLKQKSLILTTEKDMARLRPHFLDPTKIFYLPIEMTIDRQFQFDALISKFVK